VALAGAAASPPTRTRAARPPIAEESRERVRVAITDRILRRDDTSMTGIRTTRSSFPDDIHSASDGGRGAMRGVPNRDPPVTV
jgi:hypothetical protein